MLLTVELLVLVLLGGMILRTFFKSRHGTLRSKKGSSRRPSWFWMKWTHRWMLRDIADGFPQIRLDLDDLLMYFHPIQIWMNPGIISSLLQISISFIVERQLNLRLCSTWSSLLRRTRSKVWQEEHQFLGKLLEEDGLPVRRDLLEGLAEKDGCGAV